MDRTVSNCMSTSEVNIADKIRYDGASFAANQDVVIVTINYRTNGESQALSHLITIFSIIHEPQQSLSSIPPHSAI